MRNTFFQALKIPVALRVADRARPRMIMNTKFKYSFSGF